MGHFEETKGNIELPQFKLEGNCYIAKTRFDDPKVMF